MSYRETEKLEIFHFEIRFKNTKVQLSHRMMNEICLTKNPLGIVHTQESADELALNR